MLASKENRETEIKALKSLKLVRCRKDSPDRTLEAYDISALKALSHSQNDGSNHSSPLPSPRAIFKLENLSRKSVSPPHIFGLKDDHGIADPNVLSSDDSIDSQAIPFSLTDVKLNAETRVENEAIQANYIDSERNQPWTMSQLDHLKKSAAEEINPSEPSQPAKFRECTVQTIKGKADADSPWSSLRRGPPSDSESMHATPGPAAETQTLVATTSIFNSNISSSAKTSPFFANKIRAESADQLAITMDRLFAPFPFAPLAGALSESRPGSEPSQRQQPKPHQPADRPPAGDFAERIRRVEQFLRDRVPGAAAFSASDGAGTPGGPQPLRGDALSRRAEAIMDRILLRGGIARPTLA